MRTHTVDVAQTWNPTVANLTLMALGSSAPEILLSCIEIFDNKLFSGALGAPCRRIRIHHVMTLCTHPYSHG